MNTHTEDATVEPQKSLRVFVVFTRRGKVDGKPFLDPWAAYMRAMQIGGDFVPAVIVRAGRAGGAE